MEEYSQSITASSNRDWLDRHTLAVQNYLRAFHLRKDWYIVTDLLYWAFPDEGRKLIENHNLSPEKKLNLFLDYFILSAQITWLMFADERYGKDAGVCELFEKAFKRAVELGRKSPRVVTLGNIKVPPFVLFGEKTDFEYFEKVFGMTRDDLLEKYDGNIPNDRYWSFRHIPSGTTAEEVWVYCSELETMLPARDSAAPENKLFAMISGTFAQNHVKLIGCVKLASKVDLNAIRGCNIKTFKYINPEKLKITNVERSNILTPLGGWLLPSDPNDKTETLLAFDSQLFSVPLDLPLWWTQKYSEQFSEVSKEDIWDYIEATCEDLTATPIMTIIAQKFRNKIITRQEIQVYLAEQKK
jgi:hypothetical protein